jgi:hypothetical protein
MSRPGTIFKVAEDALGNFIESCLAECGKALGSVSVFLDGQTVDFKAARSECARRFLARACGCAYADTNVVDSRKELTSVVDRFTTTFTPAFTPAFTPPCKPNGRVRWWKRQQTASQSQNHATSLPRVYNTVVAVRMIELSMLSCEEASELKDRLRNALEAAAERIESAFARLHKHPSTRSTIEKLDQRASLVISFSVASETAWRCHSSSRVVRARPS